MKEPYEIRILKHLYSSGGDEKDVDCIHLLRKIYQELYEEMKNDIVSNPHNLTFGNLVLHRISKIIQDLMENELAFFSHHAVGMGLNKNGPNESGLITLDNCQPITGSLTKRGFEYVSSLYSKEYVALIQENQVNMHIPQKVSQKGMEMVLWLLTFISIGMIFYESLKNFNVHHSH